MVLKARKYWYIDETLESPIEVDAKDPRVQKHLSELKAQRKVPKKKKD